MIIGKICLQMIAAYYFEDKKRPLSPLFIVMFRGTPCIYSHFKVFCWMYILENIFTKQNKTNGLTERLNVFENNSVF